MHPREADLAAEFRSLEVAITRHSVDHRQADGRQFVHLPSPSEP